MTISLKLKLCQSKFKQGIERQKEGHYGTKIMLIFTGAVDLFLIPYF